MTPIAGGSVFNTIWSVAGTTDWGYNISAPGTAYAGSTASEMAYMFYNNLGGQGLYAPDGSTNSQWGLVNGPGFFTNLQAPYWSGTEVASGSGNAWVCDARYGGQGRNLKDVQMYAWAVRSGDVAAVPLPAAAWLFGSALAGLLAVPSWRRRRLG